MHPPGNATQCDFAFAVRGFMKPVLAPFALFCPARARKRDYLPAAVCIMGAVNFIFRS
jgi:uncharacterized protein (DUF486 family)